MNKQVPTKNYVIFLIIVVLTVFAVFYARNWYLTAKEYNSDNSPMLKAISEINKDEISNYTLENPKFIIYTSSGSNTNIKNFESKFKNYVINKNLTQSIVYINTATTDLQDLNNQLKNYAANENIRNKIAVSENVNMFVFENGKIKDIIIDANNLTTKQIEALFKKYGIIDNA